MYTCGDQFGLETFMVPQRARFQGLPWRRGNNWKRSGHGHGEFSPWQQVVGVSMLVEVKIGCREVVKE